MVLELPESDIRYYTVQLINAYQTILGYAGKGVNRCGSGPLRHHAAGVGRGVVPAGAKQMAATTTLVLALALTLVVGATRVLKPRNACRLVEPTGAIDGLSADRQPPIAEGEALNLFPKLDLSDDPEAYFSELDVLVHRYPPPAQEAPEFDQLAPLALGTGAVTRLPADTLRNALTGALQKIKAFRGLSTAMGGVSIITSPTSSRTRWPCVHQSRRPRRQCRAAIILTSWRCMTRKAKR